MWRRHTPKVNGSRDSIALGIFGRSSCMVPKLWRFVTSKLHSYCIELLIKVYQYRDNEMGNILSI